MLGRMPFGGYYSYSYSYSRDLAARFLRLVTSLTSTDYSIKLLDITYKLTATSRTRALRNLVRASCQLAF